MLRVHKGEAVLPSCWHLASVLLAVSLQMTGVSFLSYFLG